MIQLVRQSLKGYHNLERKRKLEEKSKVFTWISRIITILFTVAIVAFLVFLGVQLYRSTIYDRFDYLDITPSLKEAYKKNNDIRTRPVGKEGLSEEGTVKVTELAYITGDNKYAYIQFNVRFNKNHIDEITESCPNFSYDDVSYVLVAKNGDSILAEYELNELAKDDKYQYRYFKFEVTNVAMCDQLVLETRLMGIEKSTDEDGQSTYIDSNDQNAYVAIPDQATLQERDGGSYEYKLSRKEKKALNG